MCFIPETTQLIFEGLNINNNSVLPLLLCTLTFSTQNSRSQNVGEIDVDNRRKQSRIEKHRQR
jgi:hypothetical protein